MAAPTPSSSSRAGDLNDRSKQGGRPRCWCATERSGRAYRLSRPRKIRKASVAKRFRPENSEKRMVFDSKRKAFKGLEAIWIHLEPKKKM